jgi:putative ABC transport system permease protein
VTADFHQLGLQKTIDPMILVPVPNISTFYSLKVNEANMQQAIASLNQIWNKYFPRDPFNYFFLDESFGQQYKEDILFGKVFGVFAFLAILIACFGLLGLSAYNVLQRTKEIGVRKVLGASLQNILILLSRDFLKLVLISLFLAVPVGWFVMNRWLQDYAYRITIGWWVFAAAGAAALFIAIITLCLQVLKAAGRNPVKSLRTE